MHCGNLIGHNFYVSKTFVSNLTAFLLQDLDFRKIFQRIYKIQIALFFLKLRVSLLANELNTPNGT